MTSRHATELFGAPRPTFTFDGEEEISSDGEDWRRDFVKNFAKSSKKRRLVFLDGESEGSSEAENDSGIDNDSVEIDMGGLDEESPLYSFDSAERYMYVGDSSRDGSFRLKTAEIHTPPPPASRSPHGKDQDVMIEIPPDLEENLADEKEAKPQTWFETLKPVNLKIGFWSWIWGYDT